MNKLGGFWNYDQMALQVEDVYDVVSVKFPQYDFLLLLDQSSGRGRMREGSLNENLMSSRFGGKQGTLRNSEIKEIGPYQSILNVGDIQHMNFRDGDRGPFYLKNRLDQMYDKGSGEYKIVTKSKKEIKEELKSKGDFVRGHCDREKMEKLAAENNIVTTYVP